VDENDSDKFNAILTKCNTNNRKVMRVQTYGQLFKIRLYAAHHFVFYQPLDRDWDDYRLANPFKELEEFLLSFDMKGLKNKNEYEHYHTP